MVQLMNRLSTLSEWGQNVVLGGQLYTVPTYGGVLVPQQQGGVYGYGAQPMLATQMSVAQVHFVQAPPPPPQIFAPAPQAVPAPQTPLE